MDIPTTQNPTPIQQLSFFQLRQAFQNVGIKVTKRSIRSYDYVSGVSGWKIDSNGNVEFNNGTFRGTLESGAIYIPSQASPKFSVDSLGNAIVNSLRRNDFQWFTIFESFDNYFKGGTGTPLYTPGYKEITISTSGTNGDSFQFIKALQTTFGYLSWNKDRRIKMGINPSSGSAGYSCYIVCGSGATSATQKIGFFLSGIDASTFTLNAVVGNGVSQTLAGLGTFSFNTPLQLEARFVSGSKVDFYVNGVFAVTITTTLPSSTTLSENLLWAECITGGGVQTLQITFYDFWQAN